MEIKNDDQTIEHKLIGSEASIRNKARTNYREARFPLSFQSNTALEVSVIVGGCMTHDTSVTAPPVTKATRTQAIYRSTYSTL